MYWITIEVNVLLFNDFFLDFFFFVSENLVILTIKPLFRDI